MRNLMRISIEIVAALFVITGIAMMLVTDWMGK